MTEEKTIGVAPDGGEQAEREIRWICHPVRNAHRKTAIMAVVIIATALLLYVNTGSVAWAALSVFILAVGIHDFLLPTEYHLTENGVESRLLFYRRHRSWATVRSFHPDRHGVLLSPFPGRSRLEGFRGIYVRFAGNRNEVMQYVKRRMTGMEP